MSVISKARGVSCSASEDEAKTWCNEDLESSGAKTSKLTSLDVLPARLNGMARAAQELSGGLGFWLAGLDASWHSDEGQMLNARLGTSKCVASAIGVSDGRKRFIDAARTTPSVRPQKEAAVSHSNSRLIVPVACALASHIWIPCKPSGISIASACLLH